MPEIYKPEVSTMKLALRIRELCIEAGAWPKRSARPNVLPVELKVDIECEVEKMKEDYRLRQYHELASEEESSLERLKDIKRRRDEEQAYLDSDIAARGRILAAKLALERATGVVWNSREVGEGILGLGDYK